MRPDPILDAFAHLVRRDAHAPLVASPRGSATRGEIDALATVLSSRLASTGVTPGAVVLLAAPNGAGFLAGIVGCRRAGLVPALCDRAAPAVERERIARALGAAAEVAGDDAFPRDADAIAVRETGIAARVGAGDYVKITSGTSGEPGGVAVGAEALAADDDQLAASMGLAAEDRFLAAIPWSHSYGLSSLVLPALRRGSLLVLPGEGGPWSPLAAARAFEATVFPTVPVYLRAIVEIAPRDAWPPSLGKVVSAGARLAPDDARAFRERFGRPAHVFYGASECGGITYDREGGAAERGTVGTPVEGVTIRLEDGTIVVTSAAVTSGVFRTADRGEWCGEELRLLGRLDAVINVEGKKVDPAEVEGVLAGLSGVREAVVLGVPAAGFGKEIVRAVIAREPGRLSYEEVASWCRSRLAPHKVPRSIVLVDAIPRTARGKVDRAALLALPVHKDAT
jgi:acyl-CoA synthetase (AMP-forming)/AMP-acid ligase II